MSTTPTPAELRSELERLVLTDLLGPSDTHEQLPGVRSPVREWYLVGMLAPMGTIVDPSRNDGDDLQDGDEGGAPGPDDRPSKVVLFPSSVGLTAAVDPSCSSLEVSASWGRYEKIDNPDETAVREYARLWQRHPAGGMVTVRLVEGDIDPFAPDPAQPEVVVRGRCRATPNCWLITLFLVNEQMPTATNIDERWLFQIDLSAAAGDGSAVFVGRQLALPQETTHSDAELRHLDLLYREKVEFAVGHGIAVHADAAPDDPHRATAVRTAVIPRSEVAKVEAPGPDDPALDEVERELMGRVDFDMEALSKLDGPAATAALCPLADAYDRWLRRQEARVAGFSGEEAEAARVAVDTARGIAARLRVGIELLTSDPVAAEAFAFANHTMWQQRVHTLVGLARRDDPKLNLADAEALIATTPNWSWRPFQIAFVLVNLPSLADPTHAERQLNTGTADLLFFPTGGGKTEAYLGLTAFTLAIRRLQGDVDGHSGEGGVGVLMRYTLRLLTSQQFQRAATLICACEVRRRELVAAGDERWGETPFRIGMWVGGSVSANKTQDAARDLDDLRNTGWAKGAGPTSLVACPWCGEELDPKRDATSHKHLWRTLITCGDSKGRCPFTAKRSDGEGIPVVSVDEEIYRLLPDLVIATADKFAQLPWQGATSALFGRVTRKCSRHGFRTSDLDVVGDHKEADKHAKAGDLDAATTNDCLPRRPPDLIIQDELHLIAGPLGSLFGLYETAIDEIASWTVDGKPSRPKVVASTATIRRAEHQTYNLFCRRLAVFPPQVLDAGDSFFAVERPLDETPGRLYLGVCGMGQRFKSVATRVYTTMMAASQVLYEKHGAAADPWMTTVGYFNALRELGGMRRMLDDDVSNRLRRTDRRGLANRYVNEVKELTSRISSSDIPATLDQLGVRFTGTKPEKGRYPVDVVLATNMISVGVDVPRLGLMICSGQPKTTAEYIQATSRVGRDNAGPGLVITLYNWARPRDLSHYETFEHYHQTYYRQVEALSVTPFARRALDRGLTALMVAEARHTNAAWNPKGAAQTVPVNEPAFDSIAAALRHRADLVANPAAAAEVDQLVATRRDKWSKQQKAPGVTLTYARGRGDAIDLLQSPESGPWTEFTVPNSLREVEVGANLLLREDDPSDDPTAEYPDPPAEESDEETPLAAEDADAADGDVIIDEDAP
ncbi:MAG: helicase [Acidimicrobiia bacterium]|nr:helicase [Acidimicrobiia bacterium]